MEKIPHTSYVSILLHLKFGGLGIGYGIGRKYWPIWVLVSDLNQNSGFGRTLHLLTYTLFTQLDQLGGGIRKIQT